MDYGKGMYDDISLRPSVSPLPVHICPSPIQGWGMLTPLLPLYVG